MTRPSFTNQFSPVLGGVDQPLTFEQRLQACKNLGVWCVLYDGNTLPLSHSANTNETEVLRVPIPAGALGDKGSVRVTAVWSGANAHTSTVTLKMYHLASAAAFSGTPIYSASIASGTDSVRINPRLMQSRSPTSHVFLAAGSDSTSGDIALSSVNTTAETDLVFTLQTTIANAANEATINQLIVELLYGE